MTNYLFINNKPSIIRLNRDMLEEVINPNVYDRKYLDSEIKMKNSGYRVVSLNQVSEKIVDGPFGSQLKVEDYTEDGYPLFRVKNIVEGLIQDEDMVYIDSKKQLELRRSEVKKGDVLITKAGRIGSAAVNTYASGNITSHLCLIRTRENLSPYYLVAFLESEYGKLNAERWSHKSTRPELTKSEVESIKILLPPMMIQVYIGNKIIKAEQLQIEAKRLNEEVRKKFFDYTLLDATIVVSRESDKNFTKEWGTFVEPKNITNLLGAEVYKSDYVENQNKIRSLNNYVNFDDCYEYIVNGVDSRNYTNVNGTAYYKVAAIDMYGIEDRSVDYIDISIDSINVKQKIEEGDLLITRKGSFGIAMGVQSKDTAGIISSEVFKVRIKKGWDADYLAYFLNSEYGQKQFLQFATGSTMKGISQQNIVEIVVPKIEYNKQQEIGSLVRSIKDMYSKSRELIQQAKNDVESLIEGTLDVSIINEEQ